MPYIKPANRPQYEVHIKALLSILVAAPIGDLNYVISKLLAGLWKRDKSYGNGNAIVGCMECAKLEFTRRVLSPYEDAKIAENGDVYEDQTTADENWEYKSCHN